MSNFIGRKEELTRFEPYKKSKSSALIVIRGRRRIGKSRLAEEAATGLNFIKISGLPPSGSDEPINQKRHFSDSLERLGYSRPDDSDWYNLLLHLAQNLPNKPTLLLLDEISWMADGDNTFLPKLKDIWDEHFKKNKNLILVLCGSVSSWIDKNILSSTGFFGRINETITLRELSLPESLEMLSLQGFKGSNFEKMMLLSVTGGVPWYLEQFKKGSTAESHIRRLAFTEDGILVNEFERIFNDLFNKRANTYIKIISQLANGSLSYQEISAGANYSSSSTLSEYLNDLEVAGFISRDKSWSFKTGVNKKVFLYRLSDNYLRFYLKCIQPNLNRIESGHFKETSMSSLKGFSTLVGLQFENLVLRNRPLIIDALNLKRQNIIADNPYWQRGGKTQAGCQIDYLIQTEFNTLFICEIKFSKSAISNKVIDELKAKIKALKKPKNIACLPVLIYF